MSRGRGVDLDARPQPLDVHVEGLGVADVVGAPHPVDEHVAGEHPPGVLHQQPQQLELLAPQVHLLAAHVDPALVEVDPDVAGLPGDAVARRRARSPRRVVGAGAGMRRSTARMRATSSRRR